MKRYSGRTFEVSDNYILEDRLITGQSSNNVWLYSTDVIRDIESDKLIVQIVRWRAKGSKKTKKPLTWHKYRSYNIRSVKQWENARQGVDRCLPYLSENDGEAQAIVDPHIDDFPASEFISQMTEAIDNQTRLAKHHEELKNRAEETLRLRSRHVKEYKKIMTEFRLLIEDQDSTETDVHKFIEDKNAVWMFGLEYTSIECKVRFPPGHKKFEFDIMLKRMDGFHDLVELKGPNESIFNARTPNRSKPNVKLSEALGQVIVYLNECDTANLARIFKPKAIVVIGNRESDNTKQRRLLQAHMSNVEIMTYHDLLDRGKALVEHLDKWRLKAK